jgi:hypothetical protein
MEQVLRLIADYQWWIYGVFGLLLLFYLWRAMLARREGARSIFKLEQEQARIRYGRNAVMAALILLIMAIIFGLSNLVLPKLTGQPAETQVPTLTVTSGPLPAPTLTATAAPPTITPTASPTLIRPTQVRPPTPTSEVAETPTPVVRPANCPNPNVRITSPGVNQAVSGNVAIRGTATDPNFQYYKIEVGTGPNPEAWTVVGQLRYSPVSNGVLETFNANAYPPGVYTLRLVVVDQTANYPEPCRVTITVQR